jgi:hypothetical protein
MVFVTEMIISATETMLTVTEMIVSLIKIMVAVAETIILVVNIIVSATEKMVSVTQMIMSAAETMILVMKKVFIALKKMLSVPSTNRFTGRKSCAASWKPEDIFSLVICSSFRRGLFPSNKDHRHPALFAVKFQQV